MPRIELGAVGVVLSPATNGLAAAAREVEALGYPTLWLTGGPLRSLGQVRQVVEATSRIRVATGILSVDLFPAADVAALYTELEASHPGRFVVGLGGAHGPRPLRTLADYVNALGGAVPRTALAFAALGPKMLAFAREHGAAAYPVLVTPEYTQEIRGSLGDDTTLAVSQLAVLDAADPARARAAARAPLGFLGSLPAYQAHFARMGFTDEEIATLADRLVDDLVPHGEVAAAAAAVAAQSAAGADHVAISLVTDGEEAPLASLRALAEVLPV
ncbi:F420-dependent oxidoreductase [Frankia canadensis]|uniref:F420-dependent oxidoreductase n=1 Tax=Frankia canadensis TaxID=1836972 RepID=A0A2I2KWN0_9ACTN|nr:TIGR03620 family F420-dependent LLM class oxidoreductase [Frankia canadensis]SNQ50093.1 F420-dependent oxidoreductase [Frankia canadensis]SOU57383.1 F420-dependent oxidoreductase [Frankia canadensis]